MENKLTGRGGAGRGQGRKQGSGTKSKVSITLDYDLIKWIEKNVAGKNMSDKCNKVLRAHKERIEQMRRDLEVEGEVI